MIAIFEIISIISRNDASAGLVRNKYTLARNIVCYTIEIYFILNFEVLRLSNSYIS